MVGTGEQAADQFDHVRIRTEPIQVLQDEPVRDRVEARRDVSAHGPLKAVPAEGRSSPECIGCSDTASVGEAEWRQEWIDPLAEDAGEGGLDYLVGKVRQAEGPLLAGFAFHVDTDNGERVAAVGPGGQLVVEPIQECSRIRELLVDSCAGVASPAGIRDDRSQSNSQPPRIGDFIDQRRRVRRPCIHASATDPAFAGNHRCGGEVECSAVVAG